MLNLYPNQKAIKIGAKPLCDKDNFYQILNLDSRDLAMANLDGNCFKLWLYLTGNREGFAMGLSRKELELKGLKKDAYLRAVNILIEKGYLIPCEVTPGVEGYLFEELPD